MHINIVVHSDSEHSRPEELKSRPPPPPPLFTPSLAKERLDVALLVVLVLTAVPTTAVGVESVQAMSYPIFGDFMGATYLYSAADGEPSRGYAHERTTLQRQLIPFPTSTIVGTPALAYAARWTHMFSDLHCNSNANGGNPSASPHSPAQALPPSIAIPPHAQGPHSAHPGAPNPQMGLGPSPTTASPVQQPTSPHYTHASPTQQYHPNAHGGVGHDLYAAQSGLMAPPAAPSYGFGQPGQPIPPGQWHGAGAVQGGYARR
ncbi:hypothetical protein EDB89DRAFT_2126043 [Lactarius sanguifluus]|nr:hypothetical protein EDB89DRAFT_2126043 [Lactarius sanguifluus]